MAEGLEIGNRPQFGEPPAALLRRAISHVESLLYRLDPPTASFPDRPKALPPAAEVASDQVDVARAGIEEHRAQTVEMLVRAQDGVREARDAVVGLIDVLSDSLVTLDASARSLHKLLVEIVP